jgi:hypothetical protein
MSVQAITWAWNADLPAARKIVLLGLADFADMDATCFPSQKTLAKRCGLARGTINRVLGDLERDGWITIIPRQHDSGADRSYVYQLALPLQKRSEPAKVPVGGFVYVATDGEQTKIGVSRNAEQRVSQIALAAGRSVNLVRSFPAPMPIARKVEQATFDVLAEYRTRGEWFSCGPDQAVAAVEAALAGHGGGVTLGYRGGVTEDDTPCHSLRHLGVTEDDTLNLNLNQESNLSAREAWQADGPPRARSTEEAEAERKEVGAAMLELARSLGKPKAA